MSDLDENIKVKMKRELDRLTEAGYTPTLLVLDLLSMKEALAEYTSAEIANAGPFPWPIVAPQEWGRSPTNEFYYWSVEIKFDPYKDGIVEDSIRALPDTPDGLIVLEAQNP